MKKIIFTTLIFCLALASAPIMAAIVTEDYISDPSKTYLSIHEVYMHDSGGYDTTLSGGTVVHVIEPKMYPTGYPADDDSSSSTWDNGTGNYFETTAPAGTDWIWDTELALRPGQTAGSDTDSARWGHAVLFRVDFPIPSNAINLSATIHISADNCWTCWINSGPKVSSDSAYNTTTTGWEIGPMLQAQVKTNNWQMVDHETLTGLTAGNPNTLWVLAGNEEYDENADGTIPSQYTYWEKNPGGAIFWLEVTYEEEEEEPGEEGCTPGFWKNNADKKGASAWYCYAPGDDFNVEFGIPEVELRAKGKNVYTNPTLLDALNANGSGVNLMARAAVAALLNACNPDVLYPLTSDEIIAAVQLAVAGGLEQELGEELDDLNNLGCPINQKGERIVPLPE